MSDPRPSSLNGLREHKLHGLLLLGNKVFQTQLDDSEVVRVLEEFAVELFREDRMEPFLGELGTRKFDLEVVYGFEYRLRNTVSGLVTFRSRTSDMADSDKEQHVHVKEEASAPGKYAASIDITKAACDVADGTHLAVQMLDGSKARIS